VTVNSQKQHIKLIRRTLISRNQLIFNSHINKIRGISISTDNKKTIIRYEFVGAIIIILLGSALHFTFELAGKQPIVGVFSAVNESVWEHLKLAFWPALLYTLIEYVLLKKQVNNFFQAKALGVCSMIAIIPLVFYSYTAVTGESIFAVDISTFIIAVIIGQFLGFKLFTYKKTPENFKIIALAILVLLAITFALFTFYPPHLPIFQDPITGNYGIP
jgi:hypothetical protein